MIFMRRILELIKKERVGIIIMFALALLIRLYFLFALGEPPDADELNYDMFAMSLLERHEFGVNGAPTAYITPFYPLFLAGVYFLFGHNYIAVHIIQALLGASLCLMLYFIAKEVLVEE